MSMLLMVWTVCSVAQAAPEVQVEELVTRYEPADNGAGPLWCYGSPLIARDGENVYASAIETGKDVPPLCNTRWQLWSRGEDGWQLLQHEQAFRQREPCPIALFPGGPVFLSVNPSTQPPGTKYGPCSPAVLQFNAQSPGARPVVLEPAWAEGTQFTDHSYRGFAADGVRRELLALNIHAGRGDLFVSFRDRQGAWHARGSIAFPIRSCYPQAGLRGGSAHVMAIGDIVEPNAEWRQLKKEVTGRDWDYVFRRLFYTWTADVAGKPFAQPIEIDSVEATGGHILNCDLYLESPDVCHLLYVRRPHQHAFLRDKYFPGQAMTSHLMHVVVRAGQVVQRRTLAETPGSGDGIEPTFARFHARANGQLCVLVAGVEYQGGKAGAFGNFFGMMGDSAGGTEQPRLERIALSHPFQRFFNNAPAGGSAPSDTIDLFGTGQEPLSLRYARLRVR